MMINEETNTEGKKNNLLQYPNPKLFGKSWQRALPMDFFLRPFGPANMRIGYG